MDRVRELGDASVPFRFDVHGLFFSDDAVTLETELHHRFADRRVNLVNMRREFFYATPAEVRDALADIGNDHVLEYNADPEALEWRASDPARRASVTEPEDERPTALLPALVPADNAELDGDLSDDGQP